MESLPMIIPRAAVKQSVNQYVVLKHDVTGCVLSVSVFREGGRLLENNLSTPSRAGKPAPEEAEIPRKRLLKYDTLYERALKNRTRMSVSNGGPLVR